MTSKYSFVLFIALLFAGIAHSQNPKDVVWDKEIKVETGLQEFGDAKYPALSIPIYEVKEKTITKDMLKDFVKEHESKLSAKKGVLSAESISLPSIDAAPLDVYATFDKDKKNDAAIMHIALLKDGIAINPEDHPEMYRKAKDAAHKLGVDLNRAVVQQQVAEQENILEKLKKDLEKVEKEAANLDKDAGKAKKNLSSAEKDQASEEAELQAKRAELQELEAQVALGGTAKQAQELTKLRKSVEKSEKKIEKLKKAEEKYQKNMTKAGEAAPKTQKDANELTKEIADQKALVEAYKKKLAAIK